MADLVLLLGSNVGDREENLRLALTLIHERIGKITAHSRFYETKPLTKISFDIDIEDDTPFYLNSACRVDTTLEPQVLLENLEQIEKKLGRPLTEKGEWLPRVIDIDILAFDDLCIATPTLTIPHPELHRRDFAMVPLLEIFPDFVHPVFNVKGNLLLEQIGTHFVTGQTFDPKWQPPAEWSKHEFFQ